MPQQYQIESVVDGQWVADAVGEPNLFNSVDEAEMMIVRLKTLGDDWARAEYRVSPVYTGSPEPFNQSHTLGKIARATVPSLGRAEADPDGYYRHVTRDEVYSVVELAETRLPSLLSRSGRCASGSLVRRCGNGARYTGVALDGNGWLNLWIEAEDVHSTPAEAAQYE